MCTNYLLQWNQSIVYNYGTPMVPLGVLFGTYIPILFPYRRISTHIDGRKKDLSNKNQKKTKNSKYKIQITLRVLNIK